VFSGIIVLLSRSKLMFRLSLNPPFIVNLARGFALDKLAFAGVSALDVGLRSIRETVPHKFLA